MGRISARRGGGDSTDPHGVGNVPMTPIEFLVIATVFTLIVLLTGGPKA